MAVQGARERGGVSPWAWGAMAAACLMALGSPAWAQEERPPTAIQIEHFEPLPAQGLNVLNIASSEVLPHLSPSAGLFFHYLDNPLLLVSPDNGEVIDEVIDNQVKGELMLAVGAFDFLELGVVLPLVLYQGSDGLDSLGSAFAGSDLEGFAVADMRIVPRVQILKPEVAWGFGVGALATIYAPLGDTDSFNSDGRWRVEPRLVVDWRHPELESLLISLNGGYQLRPANTARNIRIDDMFRYGVGVRLPTGIDNFQVIGSLSGFVSTVENLDPDDLEGTVEDNRNDPMEVDGGLQFLLPFNLVANVGAGTGLTQGIGAPSFRVFGSLSYTPTFRDRDGDGIEDAEDACPNRPEDFDDFQDTDGCPDLDNDGDGIPDLKDQCPDQAEDIDTFQDEDGCPDPDNDGDGILDADDRCPLEPGIAELDGCPLRDRDGDGIPDDKDRCPDEPEDKDGFEDADGCPDTDNDGDGIPDTTDKCPNQPEDFDQFQDEDGCPDPDNDGDGIPDDRDKCPLKPETINGVDDDDGCPDKGVAKVRVTRTKIEILDKVYFEYDKAVIQERSHNLLDQVAAILKANPQITKLRVEGHTDERGDDSYNLDLSQRRALAVRNYVMSKGVDETRLTYKGYGETLPIEDCSALRGSRQKKCYAKNRRVEFTILEVDGKPVGPDGAIIETQVPVEGGAGGDQTP